MRVRIAVAAVLGAVLAAGAPHTASAVTLSDLINHTNGSNGTIVNGDKIFSAFGYQPTGDMPAATGVNVTPILVAGNLGIMFQGAFHSNPGDASDALITYDVAATGGAHITDAHLFGNPLVVSGTGSMSVVETFIPDAANTMSISDTDNPAGGKSTFFVPPLTSLHVQKDILAVGITGTATMSFVDQTYSQDVPEPGAFAMFAGPAMIGMMFLRRRRAA